MWKEASLAFGNFGMEGIFGHSRNMWAEYPRFSMALHLDVSFLSWSLCCGLRGVFKTNVSWRAWGPQGRMTISGMCRQNYGALTTLAARNPASRCPSPLPGPCFSGARPRPRVEADTSQAGSAPLASHPLPVMSVSFGGVRFSVFRPSLQPHPALVCHCWAVWTSACLEVWKDGFRFVLGSACAVFSAFLFPPLWNTVRRIVCIREI